MPTNILKDVTLPEHIVANAAFGALDSVGPLLDVGPAFWPDTDEEEDELEGVNVERGAKPMLVESDVIEMEEPTGGVPNRYRVLEVEEDELDTLVPDQSYPHPSPTASR